MKIQAAVLEFTIFFSRSHTNFCFIKLYFVQSDGISERLAFYFYLFRRILQIYGSMDFILFWVYPVASKIFDSSMFQNIWGQEYFWSWNSL